MRPPPIHIRNEGDENTGPYWVAVDKRPGPPRVWTYVPDTAAPTAAACCRHVWDRYGGATAVLIYPTVRP